MTEPKSESPPTEKPSQGKVRPEMSITATRLYRWAGVNVKREWPIWIVAASTFLTGLLSILQVLFIRFRESPRLFNLLLPFGLHHWGRLLTLVFGFGLVYLSFHLFHRRRIAWWLATAGSAVAMLLHFFHGHLGYIALAPTANLVLLLISRKRFTVKSEPRSLAKGLALAIFIVLFALAYGTAGFWLLERWDFGLNFRLGDAFVRTLRQFVLVGNNDLVPRTRHARWFLDSLDIFGPTALALAAISLFRPLAYHLQTLPHQRALAKRILEEFGSSSSDFFKLWPDKSYFFSEDSRCFIAYKTALSVAISLGDSAGPETELERTTSAFLEFCSDNGWLVAFHQVLPDYLPVYRRVGLQVLKIGEEAVIDLERFFAKTMERREFRRAHRRLQTNGYTTIRYVPPFPEGLLDEVDEVSREWLSLPGRRERSFTLGSFDRSYVIETPLFALRDPNGRIIAFANEIPSYRPGEATIDLMRHRIEIPNGDMDFLFIELMQAFKQAGFTRFSLGLAPFAGVGERPGATLQERAMHQVFQHLNALFSYKGLKKYKAKFEPVWEERFLAYQGGPIGLLRVALALARVTEG